MFKSNVQSNQRLVFIAMKALNTDNTHTSWYVGLNIRYLHVPAVVKCSFINPTNTTITNLVVQQLNNPRYPVLYSPKTTELPFLLLKMFSTISSDFNSNAQHFVSKILALMFLRKITQHFQLKLFLIWIKRTPPSFYSSINYSPGVTIRSMQWTIQQLCISVLSSTLLLCTVFLSTTIV